MNTFERSLPASQVDRRWLWATRGATLLSILGAVVFVAFAFVPGLRSQCPSAREVIAVAVIFAALPYFSVLRRLWSKSPEKGLALAVVIGSFWVIAAFLGMIIAFGAGSIPLGLGAALLALTQAALAGSALKTYYSMTPEEGDRCVPVSTIVRVAVLYVGPLVVMGIYLPALLRSGQASYEREVAMYMQLINAVGATYKERFHKGYSSSLAALGPPAAGAQASASAADLIDSWQASGRTGGSYTFTYTPGRPNAAGEITTYTYTARPSNPPCRGQRSFFTDESGVIRWTDENRPAAAQDPALPQ